MWRDQANALRRRVLRSPPRPRRFLRAGVSVDEFLTELTRKGASYAVLRWFETLPAVDAGEDIDLLISDDDLAIIEPMLSPYQPFPATQKVDLYSVSGLRGTDYKGVPYFSKKLALQILENAVLLHGKYRVPAPLDHFNSLAFHAAYHKGEASGLPLSATEPASMANVDHDYGATLERLRSAVQESADLTLEGLDGYLTRKGLRPASDLLDRYQTRNPWLRRQLASERADIGLAAGLITFVVRDRAVAYIDAAASIIQRNGFELLHIVQLTIEEQKRVRESVRGGNWACGPFPHSGGDPAAIIIAYDFSYRAEPGPDGQLINENAAFTKQTIRELIDSGLARNERFNPMHSTDNGWQSLHALQALNRDGLLDDVMHEVAEIERKLELPWPIVRQLSVTGRRARVVVVDHPVHGEAVAKVFRPGAGRFFERELRARQELKGLPCVPALLDQGDNWVLTPLYTNTGTHAGRKLPGSRQVQLSCDAMLSVSAFVKGIREKGLFLLDLSTHNLVSDVHSGLLILDFEFLQSYPAATPPLEEDYTILGLATDPGFDSPVYLTHGRWDVSVRSSLYHRAICGLPARDFFGKPSRLLRPKMRLFQAFWLSAFAMHKRLQSLARRRTVRVALRLLRKMGGAKSRSELRPPAQFQLAKAARLQHP